MRAILLILAASSLAFSQNTPATGKRSDQNIPVQVDILNVCTPDADAQRGLKDALSHLPKAPGFSSDYEVARGVATLEEGKSSKYVRLRRDVNGDSPLVTIQYSLSVDPENTVETLVFRGRDVKQLLALSIEDKLSTGVSKPSTVIQSDTPASRVRVERAGKTTLGLARCQGVNQDAYEPIFAQASAALVDYRRILKLRTMLASDLAWMTPAVNTKATKTK